MIIQEELPSLIDQMKSVPIVDINNLEEKIDAAKAPWISGF
jgi:hypothetical protein